MSYRTRSYPSLAARWALQGNALDTATRGRYDGTLVNAPTWATGPKGKQCIEFDGNNQYVNCGDVLELNSVAAFTVCFWMSQDVLDQYDEIFRKYLDASNAVAAWTSGGWFYFLISDGATYGRFDYSTVISAANWHHVAWVFDGAGAANADRLICYVDGIPVTLAYGGTIPAITDDLSGADVTIGAAINTFDGKLWDVRLCSVSLSRDEVNDVIHEAVPIF